MANLIKDGDDYGLFIVEASVGAQDWYTDGDKIEDIDWDLITDGEDALFLPYAGRIKQTPLYNVQIIDFFDNQGVDISLGEGHWVFSSQGRYGGSSEADRNSKEEKILTMYGGHVNFANGALFLGYRKIGEVWKPFLDGNQDIIYYLRGKLLILETWREANQNYINWKCVFRGVW